MANTSFKAENGLLVTGNAQFDYGSVFNANVTVQADQWYIGGNLYVTGTQTFVGGNSAVADILAGIPGLKIGNTTNQFDGYFANVYVYGTALNPVGNTVQLGNSTNRWVISGNSLNISTTSTFTGAANALSTFGITGAANALSTLGVREATTLANTLAVTGSATFANTVAVTGNTTLTNLSISGTANALGAFGITGAANALSTFGVREATTLANTLAVTGTVTFANTLAVTGNTTLSSNVTLSGALQTISGNAAFNGTTLFVDSVNSRVGIGTNAPDVTLKVQGTFNANGQATFANTTAHTGAATFANTVQVTGTASFNDVSVAGNLTVSGTTTYINTQNLNIGDNIITLNADLPVSSAPTENTGIEINRGSSANSLLQWNELNDVWQISSGSISAFYNIVNEGPSNTNLDSGTLFVDAFNNRVGINTATPVQVFEVVTGLTGISSFTDVAGNGRLWLTGNASGSWVFNRDNSGLRFGTANTERMRIDSTGFVSALAGLTVTGSTNTSTQFNVGGGPATTNGATITNTSILLGNSSVNTQIFPSQILIRTNATGNAYSLLTLASSDQVGGSLTLQHGNTSSNSVIVLGSQAGNNASIELGGSTAAFIDFKAPNEDDFDTRLLSNVSGFHIIAGSSTSANVLNITSANVNIDSGTLFVDQTTNRVGINNTAPGVALRVTGAVDISSTANVQGAGNVGGTLGVAGLITGSAGLVVTGIANVSSNLNVGTFGTTNGVNIQNTAIIVGNNTVNSSLTPKILSIGADTAGLSTLYKSWTSADTDIDGLITGSQYGTLIESVSSGHFTLGIRSNDLGDGFQIVTKQAGDATYTLNAFEVKVDGKTNIANNLTVTGIANVTTSVNSALLTVGTAFIANTTGAYHTGTVNAASHTVGALFTANSTLVNAAAINVTGRVNTATLYATTSANVGTAFLANTTGVYHTGTVNAASVTVGSNFIANTTGAYHTGTVNAASYTIGTSYRANTSLIYANTIVKSQNRILSPSQFANKGTGQITLSGTASVVSGTVSNNIARITVDPSGRFAYCANEVDNTVGQFKINQLSGELTSITTAIASTGPRAIAIDPTGKFAYVLNDTGGTIFISTYSIDQSTGALTLAFTSSSFGSTAAHIAIDPTGRFLYVTSDGDGYVYYFSINQSTGGLTSVGSIFVYYNGFTASSSLTEMAIDPTGRFLYVTSPDAALVYQYSINQSTGALSLITSISTGLTAYCIAMDPVGRFVYVSANDSNSISQYNINQTTGALTLGSTITTTANPTSIVVDSSGFFVYVIIMSTGAIGQYSINQTTGALTSINTDVTTLNSVSLFGLAIDPTSRFLYSVASNLIEYCFINGVSAGSLISGYIQAGNNSIYSYFDPTNKTGCGYERLNVGADATTYGRVVNITYSNTTLSSARTNYGNELIYINRSHHADVSGTAQLSDIYGYTVFLYNGDQSARGNARADAMFGINGDVRNYSNGATANSITSAYGVQSFVRQYGTGPITTAYGISATVTAGNSSVTGDVTTAYGIKSQLNSNTNCNIATGYLFYGSYTGSNFTTKNGLFITGESNNSVSSNMRVGGALTVVGALSKGSGTFLIDHPLDPENKNLYHGFVEAPRYDLIYRGEIILQNGTAEVDIDLASNMTPGTFDALTQNQKVTSLCNQSGFDRIKSTPIANGKFTIISENVDSNDTIVWVVMGERKDVFIKTVNNTDAEGRLIPEWDKEE